jgi:hypothetical protein
MRKSWALASVGSSVSFDQMAAWTGITAAVMVTVPPMGMYDQAWVLRGLLVGTMVPAHENIDGEQGTCGRQRGRRGPRMGLAGAGSKAVLVSHEAASSAAVMYT